MARAPMLGLGLALLLAGCTSEAPPSTTVPQPAVPKAAPLGPLVTDLRLGERTVYIETASFVQPEQLRAVEAAMRAWEQAGAATFRRVPAQPANITVQFIKEWGGETLGQHFGGLAQIGVGDSPCGVWHAFDLRTVEHVARHELGHALGLDHSADPSNVMYESFERDILVDLRDEDLLAPGISVFFQPCAREGSVQAFRFEVRSDAPVEVMALPSEAESDRFRAGEPFVHYEGCRASSTTSVDLVCALAAGGGWFVANLGSGQARVHTRIVELPPPA